MAVLPNHPQVIITTLRHPRRGAHGRRLRLLVGHHGDRDGRPRRHPCRRAQALRRRSQGAVDRPGAAGELLHRGRLPRPLAQAAEVRHLDRGSAGRREKAAGVTIKPKDTVLLHMDFFRRTHGTPGFLTDFPGLTKESATWLGGQGHRHVRRRGGQSRAARAATISRCTTSAATSASRTSRASSISTSWSARAASASSASR